MLNEADFEQLCRKKFDLIKKNFESRKVWIYGAGTGGYILKRVLEESQISICGFIDKNADNLSDKDGLVIKKLEDVDKNNIYILVSLRAYDTGVISECKRAGIDMRDIYYIVAGELCNKDDIVYKGCRVGRYTYGYEDLLKYYPFAKEIGRYCSINPTARIWNNHSVDCVTSHPILDHPIFLEWIKYCEVQEYLEQYGRYTENVRLEDSKIRNNKPIYIGNDVWIGANVVILPGVNIGDGAIIAAGAIVTKDIEDYAIVGGVPARVIRYRFNSDIREAMKKIKWWEWSHEEIMNNIELFYQPDEFVRAFNM